MAFGLAYYGLAGGLAALAAAGYYVQRILAKDAGTPKMQEIAAAIQSGAEAYLKRQLLTIAGFALVVAVLLWFGISQEAALSFALGAFASYLAGVVGMSISVRANVRTAEAAKKGLREALSLAFEGGAVTGLLVIGLGLVGLAAVYLAFNNVAALIGFGLGASLISLFARVGGGIYTKAADVGADLVGKVEAGIPEDDPRNPAVIADNVGDNVGDCAGMGADLFESFVVTLMATMLLGLAFGEGSVWVTLPLLVGTIGVISALLGMQFVKLEKDKKIMKALNRGTYVTVFAFAVLLFFAFTMGLEGTVAINYWYAALVGLALTVVVSKITEYYTAKEHTPVQEIAQASRTGAATNLIQGLAVGMQSTAIPVLAILVGVLLAFKFAGVYGIALAASAMLSCTAIIIAIDAYGPITDNAGGIAEMARLPESVRKVTDALDAVGNTTKATTKGFAIASAALGALSLFVAYSEAVGLRILNLLEPSVVVGLFLGGLLPFVFASYLMKAVGKAAFKMVEEVRRQFKSIKGILKGTAKPDYARCVDISTSAALHELFAPAVIAVTTPLIVGFVLGPAALGGLLAGAIVTGLLLALFMANGGAAWDNAKKYIESGNLGGKGSDAHKAAVVGDTVGDPFKDTAGPALNALLKVLNTVALMAAAVIAASVPAWI